MIVVLAAGFGWAVCREASANVISMFCWWILTYCLASIVRVGCLQGQEHVQLCRSAQLTATASDCNREKVCECAGARIAIGS